MIDETAKQKINGILSESENLADLKTKAKAISPQNKETGKLNRAKKLRLQKTTESETAFLKLIKTTSDFLARRKK